MERKLVLVQILTPYQSTLNRAGRTAVLVLVCVCVLVGSTEMHWRSAFLFVLSLHADELQLIFVFKLNQSV